ncbi:MAG: UDP-2,3-diacylglucosamine diphosphatase [Gammaproteobacteria bacterium]|nr:UDP-2,3-diacylglucosamine diphosphatase [Gammaproteobacteria bacterium]
MKPQTLFISDLHLQETEPHIVTLFEQFLNQYAPQAETLYILGDLFEVWPGDDENTPFAQKIKTLIKTCVSNGTPVKILPGNRDFLLGPRFAQETGCTVLKDPTVIQLYNEAILLLHGDTLCTQDRLHQIYRSIVQNPLFNRFATTVLPLSFRKKMGGLLRKFSKKHTKKLNPTAMDVIKESVSLAFKNHNTRIMIHGHTHRQKTDVTNENNKIFTRYVLNAWHETGSALSIDANGNKNFLEVKSSLQKLA